VIFKLASTDDSDVGKTWMRAQAVEILGYLNNPGQGNKVVNLLLSIVTDKKASPKLRCTAAEAIGQINLSTAAGVNAGAVYTAVVQLMKDGCETELKVAKDKKETVSVRAVKAYMFALNAALGDASKGIKSMQGAASLKISELQKTLKDLLTKLDSEDGTDEDRDKAVKDAKDKLK
jgi:hypothetical protein